MDLFKNNNILCSLNFFYYNRIQFGKALVKWNNFMSSYVIYKSKNVYVLNLEKTIFNLKSSIFFISNVTSNRGKILLIDNNSKNKVLCYFFQKITYQFFLYFKWIGGLLTNFKEFFFNQKKEKKGLLKNLTRLPEIVLFLNVYNNHVARIESQVLGIPMVAVLNLDSSPFFINFHLIGKDNDFIINLLYLSLFVESVLLGYNVERYKFFKIVKNLYYFGFLKKFNYRLK